MTDEHIEKTKAAIASAGNIPADRKAELLDLLSKLKPAIAKVSQTHHEDARSIALPRGGFGPRSNSRREETGSEQGTFARTETIRRKL